MTVFSDVRRDEIGVIPCPEARCNRSPIVLVENKLGVESWCVKFLLPYVHNKLLLYRQRKHWLDREGRRCRFEARRTQHSLTLPLSPSSGGRHLHAAAAQPRLHHRLERQVGTAQAPGRSPSLPIARHRSVLLRAAGRSCCSVVLSHLRRISTWENWLSPSSPRAQRRGSTGKPLPHVSPSPLGRALLTLVLLRLQTLGAAAGPAEPPAGRAADPHAAGGDEGVLRRRLPLPQQLQRLVPPHLGAAAAGQRQHQGERGKGGGGGGVRAATGG